jgi:hypothetical protein
MSQSQESEIEKALEGLTKRPRSQKSAAPEPFRELGPVKFRVEWGEDRNGESAVWVFVIVNDDTPLGSRDAAPRLDARLRIREALAKTGWIKPVYTRFVRQSEAGSTKAAE